MFFKNYLNPNTLNLLKKIKKSIELSLKLNK